MRAETIGGERRTGQHLTPFPFRTRNYLAVLRSEAHDAALEPEAKRGIVVATLS